MTCLDKDMDNLNLSNVIPVDEDYGRYQYEEREEEQDATSSYTIASSVYNFRVENGRRYHDYKDGHIFPSDDVSQENEMIGHEMILLLLDNKYYLSPIDESSLGCVADVGTGMGLWAEGVAEKYPDATVVGIDTTPHERTTHPNCSFIISDATEEWVLDDPSMKFDLVHLRYMFGAIKDWAALYKQSFDNMNSGGWIEQLEIEIKASTDDDSDRPGSHIKRICALHTELGAASGREFDIAATMKEHIEQAGFVDVQQQRLKLPLGPWPSDPKMKEVGRLFERFYKTGLQGWLLHICTRSWGVSVFGRLHIFIAHPAEADIA
ncbi:uncharacterized protein Z518_02383 [Rhinocladiella mackenziei CBS 650.93]|uniref:Methyltransferase domain-containing protein n=1 Tax=Rhinocladiella mackenziei CBS 650.93 TaxID=1442369 RepID=A0A0D2IPD3_9EURO|nr:uncharacterized protein Z518_02383 [Rhinocladiella mackenziei CBS 650.93]KIX07729.1 hypothetical protein Z518_02383 [Rhinocladiella mackenziei CBS 650.93]